MISIIIFISEENKIYHMSKFCSVNEIHVKRKSKGEEVRSYETGEPMFMRGATANDITGSIDGKISCGLPATPSSYWTTPAVSNVTMVVTSTNSAHLSKNFINNTNYDYTKKSINFVNFPELMKLGRVLGLVTVISYTAVILFIWAYANIQGYVYFSAGESILSIKYLEWVFGIIGIFVVIDCLRKELRDEISYNNKENINFHYKNKSQ